MSETIVGHFPLGFIQRVETPPGMGYLRVYTQGRLSDSRRAMECMFKDRTMWLPVRALRLYWGPAPRLYVQHWAVESYGKHRASKQAADALKHGIETTEG